VVPACFPRGRGLCDLINFEVLWHNSILGSHRNLGWFTAFVAFALPFASVLAGATSLSLTNSLVVSDRHEQELNQAANQPLPDDDDDAFD